MKPEWEFLTKTIFDPGVFWAMLTAVATAFLVFFAVLPLRELAKTRRTELERRLRDDFLTARIKAIMFLINHDLIEYREHAGATPFFSFARISGDRSQDRIRETPSNPFICLDSLINLSGLAGGSSRRLWKNLCLG